MGALQDDGQTLPIVLRSPQPADSPRSLQDLAQSMVIRGRGPGSVATPLAGLITLTHALTPTVILRDDGQRCVSLRVTAPALSAKQLGQLTRERVRAMPLPSGVTITWEAAPADDDKL